MCSKLIPFQATWPWSLLGITVIIFHHLLVKDTIEFTSNKHNKGTVDFRALSAVNRDPVQEEQHVIDVLTKS